MSRDERTQPATVVADRDPVTEAYKRDVDRSLLRENLKKTPTERVRALMALQRLAEEARRAGRDARTA
ncbi:MAG TPA: hypothetical protein VGA22_07705 [Gemmatimonadales bacterium]|jgi:hypothetical protein